MLRRSESGKAGSVTTVLTGAVLIGGVLKWILVLGNYPGPGAWIGLVLVVCLASAVILGRWRSMLPRERERPSPFATT